MARRLGRPVEHFKRYDRGWPSGSITRAASHV
jgi:hypothetical protein